MGLGQSSEEATVKAISSSFSTTELAKLEQLYITEKQDPKPDCPKNWSYESIKERINATFDEAVASKMINFLHMRSIVESEGKVDNEKFLNLVFYLTKDSIKDLARSVYYIAGEGDDIVTKITMQKFITSFISCLHKGHQVDSIPFPNDPGPCERFVAKITENFPETMKESDFDIMLHRTPLLIDVLQHKFRLVFFERTHEGSEEVRGTLPCLLPEADSTLKAINPEAFILSLSDTMYINSHLTIAQQHKWRLLYSSRLNGESFSKMTGAMIGKGPTLVVVRDSNGHVFGGYGSESWNFSSQFQGNSKCFLFTIQPDLGTYHCTGSGYNDHFMYLNIGQETMPNGLGMGGQHDFWGMWLDQEFGKGHSKAKPACTTYGSPQLSKDEEFKIDAVTVWGVGEEPKDEVDPDYDEETTSVLDKHVEAKALLEIAGKPRVSEGLRDLEPDNPETKELQVAHDPMT